MQRSPCVSSVGGGSGVSLLVRVHCARIPLRSSERRASARLGTCDMPVHGSLLLNGGRVWQSAEVDVPPDPSQLGLGET
jgi:hypothetical protein